MDKGKILSNLHKNEDKLLLSKVFDRYEKSMRNSIPVHTDFLDPYQRAIVEKYIITDNCSFYGGYPGAERVIAVFVPEFMSADIDNLDEEFNTFFRCIFIESSKGDKLTHRDYLGALMALGIKREKIGDIILSNETSCYIIVLSEIAEYIIFNLNKVGRKNVKVKECSKEQIPIPEKNIKSINTTVASLRLDCITGASLGISRSKASEMIKSGKVYVNWEAVLNPDKQLKEGDTLSIRGKGRIMLAKIAGTTKRDRISIKLDKLV